MLSKLPKKQPSQEKISLHFNGSSCFDFQILSAEMDFASPSSSPPTPPSPLPISVGPDHQKYFFSSSPSPSPPFSPQTTHTSPESTALLSRELIRRPRDPSSFSLEKFSDESGPQSSCLEACLEWLFLRCCCWWSLLNHSTPGEGKKSNSHCLPDPSRDGCMI
ncbi:uncharacterized protein LOC131238617 [Magnolia sinica]|uniref:uncharacterized protein LOC131238617 n=1 Tax=Magnolia sinica TaxID=86752 RepID=UPI00265B6E3B|nr:uncharacterized protein LOC131238617 [Magnolia sinica]